jgi:hypothetical protein
MERLSAVRASLARYGLEVGQVEKPMPFVVVTSAGKLIPN